MNITWDTIPQALSKLLEKVESLERSYNSNNNSNEDQWFNLNGLCDYLPSKPVKQTVYALVSKRQIPFNKQGKKLYFLKSEIDLWLKEGKRKTKSEVKTAAPSFITGK